MEDARRGCELCDAQASIYCPSDNAFLCYSCDSKVHCANFLVARHVRSVICSVCRKTDGNRVSGAVISPSVAVFCRNCSPPTGGDESDSSCSSCISSTGEGGGSDEAETTSSSSMKVRRKVVIGRISNSAMAAAAKVATAAASDLKIEGILVNWCRKIGFVEEKEISQVINMAVELMNGCLDRITVLPFRISLATSFWVAVRVCRRGNNGSEGGVQTCSSGCQDLKRVEQISGVPAKLILSTESKLARVIKRKRSQDSKELKEGWAEC